MEFQKELRSLIRTVPGNNVCVDCREPNPTWASVNLGIFMCLACSGIHRAMGVHISFVKSTTLDKWTAEFVANMKNGGNERANKFFEAELPPGYPRPSTMRDREAFIRDKYQHRKWVATNSTMARRASSDGESVADTSPAVTSGGGRRKRIPPSQRRLQMKEKKADMPLPDSSVDLLGEGGEKGSAIASSDSMFANMSIKVSADPPAVSAPKEQTGVSSPVNDLLSFGMEEPEPASNNGSILDSFGTTEKSSENILANFGVVPQSSNGNASASFSSADIMSQYTANGTGHQVSHDGFHNLTMAPPHQHQGDVQTMLNGSAPHNHNQPHMVQNDDQANSLRQIQGQLEQVRAQIETARANLEHFRQSKSGILASKHALEQLSGYVDTLQMDHLDQMHGLSNEMLELRKTLNCSATQLAGDVKAVHGDISNELTDNKNNILR